MKRFFLHVLADARCIGIQHVIIACTVLSIPISAFACWRVNEEHVDALAYSEMHELRSAIMDYISPPLIPRLKPWDERRVPRICASN